MADPVLSPLPRGRHTLTREQITDAQRLRLAVGLADAMAEDGYVGTPVAAILKRAGVSRQTFYELYDDKLACFLDALDLVGAVLLGRLAEVADRPGEPLHRAELALRSYLATIAEHPSFARLYIVEVHAAGPDAIRRRAELQSHVVAALARLLDARSDAARFECEAFVAAISALVAPPLALGDLDGIRRLEAPLVELLRGLGR